MDSRFARQFRSLHGVAPDEFVTEAEFTVIEDRSGFPRAMGAGSPPKGRRRASLASLERLERLGWSALALAGGIVALAFLAAPLLVLAVFVLGLAPMTVG